MDSFISWIGGKKALKNKIVKEFPDKGTYRRYVEVFGGAGWVLFSSEKHAEIEVYNDINGKLVNLFRCVKYHAEEVQKELELTLVSREQFYDVKAQMEVQGLTDIQRAARFFILIKESFGSDLHSFGLKARDINKAKRYLLLVAERLRSIVIENQDFRKILNNNDRPDTLFYLDPPYYKAEDYYSVNFTEDDHVELKGMLNNIKGKFILSYNDCDFIRQLYKGNNIIEVSRNNNLVSAKGGARYPELIIKNFT